MQFADYFDLLKDDVLAANLLDGEQRDHVGVKETLHDLAEEVSQLGDHVRLVHGHVQLVFGKLENSLVHEELDTGSE